jgi:hypothetical protein
MKTLRRMWENCAARSLTIEQTPMQVGECSDARGCMAAAVLTHSIAMARAFAVVGVWGYYPAVRDVRDPLLRRGLKRASGFMGRRVWFHGAQGHSHRVSSKCVAAKNWRYSETEQLTDKVYRQCYMHI